MRYRDLKTAIVNAEEAVTRYGKPVHTLYWQGMDISKRPEAAMIEHCYFDFEAPMPETDLAYYQDQVKPNLPFADNAFAERISRVPSNPGEAWRTWPWAHSANKHRTEGEKFEHTYQERFWPKWANVGKWDERRLVDEPHTGIRFPYGDLDDMVKQLADDPLTRQAYLPIFFPEDTGYWGRKPCSLGYLFLMRDNRLDITYDIRSCDLYRHFRDDVYLAVRLLLWVLDECRRHNDFWDTVSPGNFHMHIASLHLFVNDKRWITNA